jgi:hypothetical protein
VSRLKTQGEGVTYCVRLHAFNLRRIPEQVSSLIPPLVLVLTFRFLQKLHRTNKIALARQTTRLCVPRKWCCRREQKLT